MMHWQRALQNKGFLVVMSPIPSAVHVEWLKGSNVYKSPKHPMEGIIVCSEMAVVKEPMQVPWTRSSPTLLLQAWKANQHLKLSSQAGTSDYPISTWHHGISVQRCTCSKWWLQLTAAFHWLLSAAAQLARQLHYLAYWQFFLSVLLKAAGCKWN